MSFTINNEIIYCPETNPDELAEKFIEEYFANIIEKEVAAILAHRDTLPIEEQEKFQICEYVEETVQIGLSKIPVKYPRFRGYPYTPSFLKDDSE